MDLIPAWVRRLWGMWDLRILVLLSLTLQIILYIFGNRRKYISSLWINILVWSAYLMADWVATVALGKLCHAQVDPASNNVNPNNALRAIWAPLLLLHLGGPDTITAYSIEDNQLWTRHFMGLGIQAAVAVYVIIMSWRNFWFSFLALPAFVAGIIKYGERTWILKSSTNYESADIIPFGNNAGELSTFGNTTPGDKYVRALVMAHNLVREFKRNLMTFYNFTPIDVPGGNRISADDVTCLWDTLEVEIGLMYDLFYTKASITYTKGGCILRSISFANTVTVLVGLLWLVFRKEKYLRERHYSMVDIAVTLVLLVGALALEIYAVIVILSSDWTMLWLIKHNKSDWVIQLGENFPWFFPMLKKKRWSNMIGQLDLLGFCLKEANRPAKLAGMLGLSGIQDKLNWHLHKARVHVPPNLHSVIIDFMSHGGNAGLISDTIVRSGFHQKYSLLEQLIILHLVTEICYHHDLLEESNNNISQNTTNSSASASASASRDHDNQTREICRILSRNMMYLLFICPTLLPISFSEDRLGLIVDDLKSSVRNAQDVSQACQRLENIPNGNGIAIAAAARDIGKALKTEQTRWIALKYKWVELLRYSAVDRHDPNRHLQQLRLGGELITWIWFFIPQSEIVERWP